MKILACFHAPPFPPDLGPSRRHFHVLDALSRKYDVTVVSIGSEEDRRRLIARFGSRLRDVHFIAWPSRMWAKMAEAAWCLARGRSQHGRLYRRRFQIALDAAVDRVRPDLLYLSTTMLGCYSLPRNVPILGDTHNVEHDVFRRASRHAHHPALRRYFGVQATLTEREERQYTAVCDTVCATSPRDASLIEALGAARVRVVPNGLDIETFPFTRANREPRTIVFTGLLSYYPNLHGAVWFLDQVLPEIVRQAGNVRMLIVGARPPKRLQRRVSQWVEVTGFVPDVRPYFTRATVCVVPLHIGGGTRVKALEAMALGTPVVSTTLGCEGLDVRHGESVLLADTPKAFAAEVSQLLGDEGLRDRLAQRARQVVVSTYDWKRIGALLHSACEETGTRTTDRPAMHA